MFYWSNFLNFLIQNWLTNQYNLQVHLSGARDITHRQPITVCPLNEQECKEEMDAIEQAAKDASHVDPTNPMLPACTIIRAKDPSALRALGWTMVGGFRKMVIEWKDEGMNEALNS